VKGIMTILKEEFSDYLFGLPIIILSGKYAGRVVVLAIHRKSKYLRNKGNVDVNIYNGDLQQLKFITVE
jgi:lysozyme